MEAQQRPRDSPRLATFPDPSPACAGCMTLLLTSYVSTARTCTPIWYDVYEQRRELRRRHWGYITLPVTRVATLRRFNFRHYKVAMFRGFEDTSHDTAILRATTNELLFFHFEFSFYHQLHLPASGQAVVKGVVPSPPTVRAFVCIAHRV